MAEGFDPFGVLGDVVMSAGGLAQSAANAVGDVAQTAANAVGDGINAAATTVGEAIHSLSPEEEQQKQGQTHFDLPPRYCASIQRKALFIMPKGITVRRVSPDAQGNPSEGREQRLSMSQDGVELCASASLLAPAVEKISVSNCCVFKEGKADGANPLLAGLLSLHTCVTVSPIVGLICALSLGQSSDKWYLYIRQHDGSDFLFRIASKEDGDELLEFLDSYMLPME